MRIFEPFKVRNLNLKNRIVLPPMCLYTADKQGFVNDRHLVHYASCAVGGTALIILESTAVLPNGRVSDHCLGIWDDSHIEGLRRIVDFCHQEGAAMAIQLGHAGRKCAAETQDSNYTVSPSAIRFDETYRVPREITREEMEHVKQAFCDSARRADTAGFDAIEIHGAHGYLLGCFLSPVSNKRTDEYGGSLENRARYLLEVIEAVRDVWPADKAIILRLSATDYLPGGTDLEETIQIIKMAGHSIDIAHITSGGVAEVDIDVFPGYQVPLAEAVKRGCDIPVIAVGRIRERDMVEEILGNGRADLVALGLEQFRNPNWVTHTAWEADWPYKWRDMYAPAYKKRS